MQLKAENIGFRFDNHPWLFRGLHFTLNQGEIVGITAPSGQGKTTLCRILAGLAMPLEGKVTVDGKEVEKKGYHPVQLIFQHPEKAVNPRWKMKKVLNEGWQVEAYLLDALGIEKEWLTRWPNELSGGELQRFCVLRALGPETRFLIADEMTTMLDAITQAQIWHAVLDVVKKRKMGMLVVSHDTNLIERICDRVVRLDRDGITSIN